MSHWTRVFMASGGLAPDSFPEDVEDSDRRVVQPYIDALVKEYFEKAYPDFEPQVIVGNEKEYYLPALKVLKFYKDKFMSPTQDAVWENMELKAECKAGTSYSRFLQRDYVPVRHGVPNEDCNCGIYGSVNLDEIFEYLHPDWLVSTTGQMLNDWKDDEWSDGTLVTRTVDIPERPKSVLCIIEPSPDAKVIRTRKGWKASHAFISEIIPETMSVEEASRLLSIAWHRNIDIRRVYENR